VSTGAILLKQGDNSTSIAQSIKKLAKDTKNLKKAFTKLQKTSEQDSDLSGSESEEEDSHFQFGVGPRDSEFTFVNTVSENKAGFMKRQIKEVEVA
jgi:hypothetical protein